MFFIRKRKKKKVKETNSSLVQFNRTIRPELPLYNLILGELYRLDAIPNDRKEIIETGEPIFMDIGLRIYKKETN